MTRADDIRAAANIEALHGDRERAARLREYASTIERVEKELRIYCDTTGSVPPFELCEMADALKGDAT